MKVGDVVADIDGWFGIVIDYRDVSVASLYAMAMVLWSDGVLEHCDIRFLKVISETG